ncbi:MAG: IS1/IS1595 family N-terminal zinc-binding domain-containing protein, partial [Bdellovibrionales bacterium]
MRCPKCRVADRVKNGKVQGKQRYRCKGCGCNYTVSSAKRRDRKRQRHGAGRDACRRSVA